MGKPFPGKELASPELREQLQKEEEAKQRKAKEAARPLGFRPRASSASSSWVVSTPGSGSAQGTGFSTGIICQRLRKLRLCRQKGLASLKNKPADHQLRKAEEKRKPKAKAKAGGSTAEPDSEDELGAVRIAPGKQGGRGPNAGPIEIDPFRRFVFAFDLCGFATLVPKAFLCFKVLRAQNKNRTQLWR